jgi:cytochrome P450
MNLPTYSARPDDPAFFTNPYSHYRTMRDLGPAFVWLEYGMVAFARYQAVNALLRDRRLGREATHVMSREDAGLEPVPEHLAPFYKFENHSLLEREPPAHTRLRVLVNRAFVSRHIERLRPRIAELAHKLIDGFEADGAADLLPGFAEKIPVAVIAELLGVPVEMSSQLLDWSHRMVAMYQFNRTREIEDSAVRATLEFTEYISAHAKARRNSPGDALIDHLLAARDKGDRLSEDELVSTCVLLLNAGHEATVHAIGNAVRALLTEAAPPFAQLFTDQDAAGGAVDELLRFDPPLHLFTRYVLEDMDYDGIPLARGQKIALLLGAANRDRDRFANPDHLDFTRGGAGHLAFGAGIHFCVGAPLARLEMAVSMQILSSRLPGLRLSEEPAYANRYHFHGLAALNVQW